MPSFNNRTQQSSRTQDGTCKWHLLSTFLSNESGTIVNKREFVNGIFFQLFLSNEPGTVMHKMEPKWHLLSTFLSNEPGTVMHKMEPKWHLLSTFLSNEPGTDEQATPEASHQALYREIMAGSDI
jgi:hypothetical protein